MKDLTDQQLAGTDPDWWERWRPHLVRQAASYRAEADKIDRTIATEDLRYKKVEDSRRAELMKLNPVDRAKAQGAEQAMNRRRGAA